MMDRKVMEKLQDWEAPDHAMAPLSTAQRNTIHELAALVEERHIPLDLPVDDNICFTHSAVSPDKHNEESLNDLRKTLTELKAETNKMETGQQFLMYYGTVEEEMSLEQEQVYWDCIKTLEKQRKQCNTLLEQVETSLENLHSLNTQYHLVAEKTTSLHDACEHLLSNQTKLNNVAETMGVKLAYFEELDRLSNRLHSPTFSILNESFIPTLSKLDECISHMTANSAYKESGVYLVKYKQCLTRALGMIKSYVTNSLQNMTQNIMSRLGCEVGESNPTFTLFYGKFRTNASRIKTVMEELETRAERCPEYEQLLTEVHQCYFRQRDLLITPSVNKAINDMAQESKRDHCALVRSGCGFLVRVCEDEHQLFYQFFTMHTPQLTTFLEGLCVTLYDVLRPIFVHIIHLETLAELCSILRNEVLEDHMPHHSSTQNGIGAFESVTLQMLQDVQERLVYRAGIYIRTDILQYRPAPGDLQYPEKLEMMQNIAESLAITPTLTRNESKESLVSAASQEVASITGATRKRTGCVADIHGLWYPPVRRTLVCLSKLYRCLDRAIFQGLSQEALSGCVQALKSAAETITKNKTPVDGQLFEIKHLLILREQIVPFHADFSVRETSLDFTSVKSAVVYSAYNLLSKRDRIFSLSSNNALLEFLIDGTPHVYESTVDSKREVDTRLKEVCESFIAHANDRLLGPLKGFITKVKVIKGISGGVKLRDQPWTAPEIVADIIAESHKYLKKTLPNLLKSMQLYLASKDTQLILFKPIRVEITSYWQNASDIIKNEYSEEEQLIIGCPLQDQVSLFIADCIARD